MKSRRIISNKIRKYNIAKVVACEHGYLALETILDDKIEALNFIKSNYNIDKLNKELLRLYEVLGDTSQINFTNEILTKREKCYRQIKILNWIKEEYK